MAHQDFSSDANGYEKDWVCHLEFVAKCPGLDFQPNRTALLYIFCIQQHPCPDRPGGSLEYWTRTEYSRQFYWSTLHLGQPHLDPPFLFREFENTIFYPVQKLRNFALIEDNTLEVKYNDKQNHYLFGKSKHKMEKHDIKIFTILGFIIYFLKLQCIFMWSWWDGRGRSNRSATKGTASMQRLEYSVGQAKDSHHHIWLAKFLVWTA